MPRITVQLACLVRRSFRVAQVAGMLDVPVDQRLTHELTAEVPGVDEAWTIGVIVGPSGSGKTTLARAAFGEIYEPLPWPEERAIVDCLEGDAGAAVRRTGVSPVRDLAFAEPAGSTDRPEAYPTIKDLTRVLCGVGLGSVPTWLKPYHVLSTGERFRADLARAIVSVQSQPLVIDEFTSSLDRTVAQTTSAALSRLLREWPGFRVQGSVRTALSGLNPEPRLPHPVFEPRTLNPLRLVALTCHDDIVPWLAPDWVLRLGGEGGPLLVRGRLRRPAVRLAVRRVRQALWGLFARHHYLAGGLAASATCYAAWWDATPAAFCAAVATLGWKKTKRITRLVTLPEFQGLGIGSKLAETVAEHEAQRGNRVTITASHPAIVSHCTRSPRWRYVELKKTGSTRQQFGEREIASSHGRAVAAFEFVGAAE